MLGTRMRRPLPPGAMPPHQLFGNQLVARLLRLLYGVQVTDLGPFRAIRRELLRRCRCRNDLRLAGGDDGQGGAARRVLVEVPVSYRPRMAGDSKVGGTVRGTVLATYRIFRVTFRYAGETSWGCQYA